MAINVLTVDDISSYRKEIRRALKKSGFAIGEIFEAENGAAALEIINAKKIDLIFTDLNMPVMSGDELVESLVSMGLIEKILVVVVSTDSNWIRRNKLVSMGVREFVEKPFTRESILSAISGIL